MDRANHVLVMAVGDTAIVRIQGSVRLNDYNEPQPDIALLRPREDFYAKQHPLPDDILLIVEVADSSLEYDRKVKARLYAATGIREYWIADLTHDFLLAHSDLRNGVYQIVRQLSRGETISPQLLPDCRVSVDSLLS